MPSPLRLTFEGEQDDTKMPATVEKGSPKRPKEISQESDEENEADDEDTEGRSHKRAKHEDTTLANLIDNSQGNYAGQMRTDEQIHILSHEPDRGDVVVVNALAGCGKTTTIALLCNKILTEHPQSSCLYLVYNSKAGKEATESDKFPAARMEIKTTHAYVLRHFFGPGNMNKGGNKKLDKRVNVIAGYIRNTVKSFQASADAAVNEKHVFWRAKDWLTDRTKWRERVKYVSWAAEFFSRVHEECKNIRDGGGNASGIDIPHDAYLKVAQMENFFHIPREFVFIDEAQDMTACQADLFWGQRQRKNKIIYLFGDRYQQIYRFRRASRSFRDMVDASSPKFTLIGSFRFGKNIANCATCVLRALGGDPLYGRSKDDGRVSVLQGEEGGVVLCRTQNGIFKHLYANRPARWCNLSGGLSNVSQDPKKWQLDLESFIQGNTTRFTYKGDTYKSINDIEQYIEDEGDDDLRKTITLLQFLVAQGKSIQEFYSDLRDSYSLMQKGESPDEYNGLVMSTVHKAKGLEFENVVVAADFCWKAITNGSLNNCDEANILYVAITRSTSNLYLTKEASDCLNEILSSLEKKGNTAS